MVDGSSIRMVSFGREVKDEKDMSQSHHPYIRIFPPSYHSIQDLGLGIKAHYSFQLQRRQGNRFDSSLGLIVVS
jgi:hypothetical protein